MWQESSLHRRRALSSPAHARVFGKMIAKTKGTNYGKEKCFVQEMAESIR